MTKHLDRMFVQKKQRRDTPSHLIHVVPERVPDGHTPGSDNHASLPQIKSQQNKKRIMIFDKECFKCGEHRLRTTERSILSFANSEISRPSAVRVPCFRRLCVFHIFREYCENRYVHTRNFLQNYLKIRQLGDLSM